MKIRQLLSASLACAVMATPVISLAGEMPEGYFYVGGHVSQYYYDFNSHEDNSGLEPATLPGAQFGWRFAPSWSLQGFWEKGDYETDTTSASEGELMTSLISGRFHLNGSSFLGLEPYVGLAAGELQITPDKSDEDNRQTLVGVEYGGQAMLTPFLSLDVGARPLWRADSESWDGEVYLGLNVIFGADGVNDSETVSTITAMVTDADGDGVADSNDSCAGTPAGATVDAQGCQLDSDGDGVANTADACSATPKGAAVNADGCIADADADGVADNADACPSTPAGALVDAEGCQKVLSEDIKKSLSVEFELGKAVVRQSSYDDIGEVAELATQYSDASIELAGYTDSSGSSSLNQRLSAERAAAVKTVLVDHFGIDASRISSAGYGEANPVASNATAEGRAQNRRVEVTLKATAEKALTK